MYRIHRGSLRRRATVPAMPTPHGHGDAALLGSTHKHRQRIEKLRGVSAERFGVDAKPTFLHADRSLAAGQCCAPRTDAAHGRACPNTNSGTVEG